MTKTMTCDCGGKLVRRRYEHVQDVAGARVRDGSGLVRVCENCGEPTLTMDEMSRYERTAAAIVLREGKVTGARLKFARKALGMTQADLGDAIGCRSETISRWEHEQAEIPRAERLAIVALLEGRPNPEQQLVEGALKVRSA